MNGLENLHEKFDCKLKNNSLIIDAPDTVRKEEYFKIRVAVFGRSVYSEKINNQISWIALYFHSEDSDVPVEIGKAGFSSGKMGVQAARSGFVDTKQEVCLGFKTDKPGILFVVSLCAVHGLRQNYKTLNIQ